MLCCFHLFGSQRVAAYYSTLIPADNIVIQKEIKPAVSKESILSPSPPPKKKKKKKKNQYAADFQWNVIQSHFQMKLVVRKLAILWQIEISDSPICIVPRLRHP